MSPPKGLCAKCGERIESFQSAVYKIDGYEAERSQGGQNHVLRKRRLGPVWHDFCFEMMTEASQGGRQLSLS